MKQYFLVFISCFLSSISFGQFPTEPTDNLSPEASTLELHTNVPISNYTGTVNLNIPLYTIETQGIEIPIGLNYHSASNKVNYHPGWVGSGWNLSVGGEIIRTVNGTNDESSSKLDGITYDKGYYYNYSKLNIPSWDVPSVIEDNFCYLPGEVPDCDNCFDSFPDEFQFNFLGYSGKFFLDQMGKWRVISNDDIVVLFDKTIGKGFVNTNQLRDQISDVIPNFIKYNDLVFFHEFTLVTPDGVQYTFGGDMGTEYAVNLRTMHKPYTVFPITWKMTKILSPTGSQIDLIYEDRKPIYNMRKVNTFTSTIREASSKLSPGCDSWSAGDSNPYFNGSLIYPTYLTQIRWKDGSIEFNSSPSKELRQFSNSEFRAKFYSYYNFYQTGYSQTMGNVIDEWYFPWDWDKPNLSLFEWYQLDSFQVKTSQNVKVKKYKFGYSQNETERLKLLSITEEGDNGELLSPHEFVYNSKKLPVYQSQRMDHWGYYNGNSKLDGISYGFNYEEKNPNGYFGIAELLEEVKFPTGGKIKLYYEPNTYSKFQEYNKTGNKFQLTSESGMAGGMRIKKVEHFDTSNPTPSKITEYKYYKNYNVSSSESSFSSSGILGIKPVYNKLFSGVDFKGTPFTIETHSTESLMEYGSNIAGSHIGYSEVTVINRDAVGERTGYTKYKYTNYDIDIWGNQHLDKVGVAINHDQMMTKPTNYSLERGKLVYSGDFNNFDQPVKETRVKYEKSSAEYVRMISVSPTYLCGISPEAQLCFADAYKVPSYQYRVSQEFTTQYNQLFPGVLSKAIKTVSKIDYSEYHRKPIRVTKNDNLDFNRVTEYAYAPDLIGGMTTPGGASNEAKVVWRMKNRNILTPLETITKVEENGVANVIGSEVIVFKDNWELAADIILPYKIHKLAANVPITNYQKLNLASSGSDLVLDTRLDLIATLNDYDASGNLLSSSKTADISTSYVWGYNQTYPVAKIVNATYAQVEAALGANFSISKSLSASQETALRNIDKAQVTTYTYKPLVGILTETDQNGRTTTYEYDSFNRLKLIKDPDGNIIKKFEYHYTDQ